MIKLLYAPNQGFYQRFFVNFGKTLRIRQELKLHKGMMIIYYLKDFTRKAIKNYD